MVLALVPTILLLGFLQLESQLIDCPRRLDWEKLLAEVNVLKQNVPRRERRTKLEKGNQWVHENKQTLSKCVYIYIYDNILIYIYMYMILYDDYKCIPGPSNVQEFLVDMVVAHFF